MSAVDIDTNTLRDEFESNAEWWLRYQFIESNKDSLPLNRLICLSRCFVNMTVYSCSYPPSVMKEVRERSKGVLEKKTEKPIYCSNAEYLKAWKEEQDPLLAKIRKLAYEIVTLKTDCPNAMDKLHSAAKEVPIQIEFYTKPLEGTKNNRSFMCCIFIEKVSIASGRGSKIKSAKTEAYEIALQKILKPYMRIVSVDPTTKEIEASETPFTVLPSEPSKFPLQKNDPNVCQYKESNLEAAGLKRRYNEYKNLDEFVIYYSRTTLHDDSAAHTLRTSADFNHMLLEYEYFLQDESARCILKIENEVLADVNGVSKMVAKNTASAQALDRLKKMCWTIKTKQAVDPDLRISKDEIFKELNKQSESIANDNIGNQMLRKMGWSGGGLGKDGGGIAEPVSLKSVLNREGFGSDSSQGITVDLRKRIREVIENYASSDNKEELVFSSEFQVEERKIIHDVCHRLNLRSKSRGKGSERFMCVSRKRSPNQLLDYLMSVGGETTRYQLLPPSCDTTLTNSGAHSAVGCSSGYVIKEGGSITEPGSLKSVVNRDSLGLGSLLSYALSDNQDDLVFSSEFLSQERKIIREKCRRLNLRVKSRGEDKEKYLCVGRKRSLKKKFALSAPSVVEPMPDVIFSTAE